MRVYRKRAALWGFGFFVCRYDVTLQLGRWVVTTEGELMWVDDEEAQAADAKDHMDEPAQEGHRRS